MYCLDSRERRSRLWRIHHRHLPRSFLDGESRRRPSRTLRCRWSDISRLIWLVQEPRRISVRLGFDTRQIRTSLTTIPPRLCAINNIGRSSQLYINEILLSKQSNGIGTCLSSHILLSKVCACSRTPAEEDCIPTLELYPKSSILARGRRLGRKSLNHSLSPASQDLSAWRDLFFGFRP